MTDPIRQVIAKVKEKLKTTLVESEWQRATRWRDRWLDAEEDEKLRDLQPQIVAYLMADAETLRSLEPLIDELEAALAAGPRPQAQLMNVQTCSCTLVTGGWHALNASCPVHGHATPPAAGPRQQEAQSAGDLLIRAVDLWATHAMACDVEECVPCTVAVNQLRLAYKVWQNSSHQSATPPAPPAVIPSPEPTGNSRSISWAHEDDGKVATPPAPPAVIPTQENHADMDASQQGARGRATGGAPGTSAGEGELHPLRPDPRPEQQAIMHQAPDRATRSREEATPRQESLQVEVPAVIPPQEDLPEAAATVLRENVWNLIGDEAAPAVIPQGVYGSEVLCESCAHVFCPRGERLHFHHDGCPACCEDEDIATAPGIKGIT
jgi:hypothetical protein